MVVEGIADEGAVCYSGFCYHKLEAHLARGSILNFGGLVLVCYTDAGSVNSFCLWHLGRRRT